MRKKLCCILMLIVLLLNSSIMIILSEAVEAIQSMTEEDKIKALAEINLIKYENYDTTTENSEGGSKGVLVQFNLKTGIEFAEDQEYKSIQNTLTNIAVPKIADNKPERVEVIVKSTQATNGGKDAKYEYHSSTGILTIMTENSDYNEKVEDARDEYEIICIYGSECYTNNEENKIKVTAGIYETLNNEEKITISKIIEEEYTCKDTVGGIISTEHETEDIYDGYIKANELNSENKYETTYNEKLKIMVSNKDIAQKIEVKETTTSSLYTETSINKEQVLDMLGENGSIDIVDDSSNTVKTINKNSEADENGKIKLTYAKRSQNLTIQLNNIEKEGIIEIESARVIEATAKIIDNTIPTQIDIKGINTVKKETENEEIVKYEHQEQNNVQAKMAISDIETKLSNDILVNNTPNNVTLTVSLNTKGPKYSLFKNPIINIEMPKEVSRMTILSTPEIMYDGNTFKVKSSNVSENEQGNKVINLELQGEQTSYGQSSIVEGINIRIPLSISLTKQLENEEGTIKCTYSNERTATTENKEISVRYLNKVVNIVPNEVQIANIGNTEKVENNNNDTAVYEQDGVKAEIIQEIGNIAMANNDTVYEQQIIKHKLRVTNNSTTSKKVSLTINIPDGMTYVKLQTGGYIKNEEKGYYTYSDKYEYEEQTDKQVTIDMDVNAGETKTDFIELKVNDMQDEVDEKQVSINNELKVDGKSVYQYETKNTVKQAEISANLKSILGVNSRKEWVYKLEIKNLTNKELKNVKVAFVASSFFNIEKVESGEGEKIGKIGENIWTYTIESLKPIKTDEKGRYEEGYVEYYIDGQVGDVDESQYSGYEINGVATIYGDSISKYVTNETRMNGYLEAVEVSMQSDKETLKRDEEITYTVNIKNIGRTFGGFDTYTSVNVKDVIPRELAPISVTYNEFEISEETVKDEKYPDLEHKVQTYSEKEVTKDLLVLDILDGYDETDSPNINIDLNIPEGKTVTMVIKAKAKMISEKTEINNTMTAKGDYVATKTASIKNTVLNYNYTEPTEPTDPSEPTEPSDPSNPTEPSDPSNPTEPSDPSNPTEPSAPSNPTEPEEPTETNKISISGTAWIDANEDGKRTTDEETYSNMKVMLYDYKNNTFVKENGQNKEVQTDSNGEYEFDDLNKGQYIVVFLYDTNTYKLTEYQKDEVIDSKNNDAITKTIGIDGKAVTAGLTDTLTADGSLKNIDIGLIENKNFDLELQKYISKITVQTNDGNTKTYTYDNKQFAKVEIHSKKINGATVVIEYKMVVTNKGEVAGKVAQIVDKLPSGLKFKSELNKDWYENNGDLYTNSLSDKTLEVGESEEITLILTKDVNNNNVGTVINTASIGISNNDKAIEDTNTQNDSSNAQVIIGVATGLTGWLGQTIGVILVLSALAVLVWKNRKILKGALFISIFAICLIGNSQQVLGASFGNPDQNITITGVFDPPGSSHMIYAKGSDGKIYHCVEKGKKFCDHPHGAKLIKHEITYSNEKWEDIETPDIELTDETDHKKVTFSKLDDKFNKVGPFKIKSSVDSVGYSVSVTYKLKNGQTKTVTINDKTVTQLIEFGWGKEFYIKVANSVVQIDKISINATYEVTQKGTKKETHYYEYNTWQLANDNCTSRGETQNMARSEEKIIEVTRKIKKDKSIEITGPWVVVGNIKIDKVDSKNANTKLKNAVFIVQKGSSTKGYMNILKGGNKVDRIVVSEIELLDSSMASTNEMSAKVNGTEGYTIKFDETTKGATRIVTNDSGSLTIKNLRFDTYTFTEVENGNYGYNKLVKQTVEVDKPLEEQTITIKNEKTVGELDIEKTDSKDTSKKFANVEFIIKSSYKNQYIKIKSDGAWQKRAEGTVTIDDTDDMEKSPTIQYTSNKDEATRFITDKNGQIAIKNLITTDGTNEIKYTVTEVYNPYYGYTKMEEDVGTFTQTSNKITVKMRNEKMVGNLSLEKVDDRNASKKFANVEFVIKSSLHKDKYIKVKAEQGNVTKDTNGWATRILGSATVTEISYVDEKESATKFVTNSEGKITVRDLLSSSNGKDEIKYKLIEVYTPNNLYLPNYNSDYISLGDTTIKAENHQEYINLQGYVWEELSTSKDNSTDDIYTSKDARVQGIRVRLYKDGKLEKTATTDANGKYKFERVKIDDLDKYYVEFEYDGLRFTSVTADKSYSGSNYKTSSKATEEASGRSDNKDRQSVNADFSEITNGKSRNNGKEVYTLNYNFADHASTYKDHWGYEYNSKKTRLKVKLSNDYAIIASTKATGYNLKSAWDAQCKKAEENLLGINLGIKRREQADLAISTDISSLNVVVQNYENTYTYENRKEYEDQNTNGTNYDAAKDCFGTEVKFGSKYASSYSNRGLNMYTRRIYESDLALYNENYTTNSELMQIYVTYKITVKNQSNSLTSIVNELANYYDSRYIIADSWIVNGDKTQQVGANGWSNTSKYGEHYDQNGYIAGYTKATSDISIAPNGKFDVYIKFKLKPEAVKALIEKQTTLNNVSEITSFSTKTLNNNKLEPYASIDVDSNPGSIKNIVLSKNESTEVTLNGRKYQIETKTLNKEKYEDDTDSAPSLVLGIEEADPTRGLSGTVFEDEDTLHKDDATHPGEERVGDGILHTGGTYRGKGQNAKIDTNRISGAKVELLEYDENSSDHIAKDANGNAKVATLYKLNVNEAGVMSTTTEKAEVTTDNKGEYLFTGVIPGRYLIRYTYNNNCYITDSKGNQIEQIKISDYKSTVITSDLIKESLNLNKKYSTEDERKGDLNWILKYDSVPNNENYTTDAKNKSKDISGLIRYSGATDNISKRGELDDIYYGSYESNSEMTADTAFFDVGVEFSEVKEENGFANKISYTDFKDEYQLSNNKILVLDENGKLKVADTFYAVNPYQDFGIIERARQDYETNKRVSNLKITLANGQTLIEGNPYKQEPDNITNIEEYWKNIESTSDNPLPYVKALPSQIVAEIDNEILQGATLNVEYTISIMNKSEKDYRYNDNQEYYYYGQNGKNEASTAIRKIVDYMEDDLAYDDQQNEALGWTKVQASELHNWTKDADNNNKQLISDDVNEAVKQGYVIAVTEYFYQPDQAIGIGKVGSIKIYGNKVLSTSEKGIDVENHVEIIETMGTRAIKSSMPGNYNPKTRTPNEPDDDMTALIITPPTGLTDNKTFIICTTVIALFALAGGIYFIKKKIIK